MCFINTLSSNGRSDNYPNYEIFSRYLQTVNRFPNIADTTVGFCLCANF